MKLNFAVLASVAVIALVSSSSAFAAQKGVRDANASMSNGCSLIKCEQIQQKQGWCPSETKNWCPRHLPMGDACTPSPSGRAPGFRCN